MTRRWTLLAGAIALSLSVPQAAFATPQEPAPAASQPDAAAEALRDLRADADGAVRVQRDQDGGVAFAGSTDGLAMVASDAASPGDAARKQLADYGDAFGIDGHDSRAVVTQTLDTVTGGSVVRTQQVVDGVPVFGGQVVVSLDEDQGVVSVTSATTDATQVPAAVVAQAKARRTAVAATAKSYRIDSGKLTATLVGRRLYDPALVHVFDPGGVRPVWEIEVTNGADIRETVLVGTGRGEVALHFNDAPGINRRICDWLNNRTPTSVGDAVPLCGGPTRTEGGPPSGVNDVDEAYDNLGETSTAYAQLSPGVDLTSLIGTEVSGQKALNASVRWCYTDNECPMQNAFWDGTQMVFGDGYAAADDVVGHELTHGFVEHTSALFALHQSGALNESLADTVGEIIDHRNGADDDSAWTIGEDLASGDLRSLKDPTLFGQPDRMTSPDYVTANGSDVEDYGAVHANDGVGNKTAYLISQGGTFNAHTVTGIDGSDPTLTKTGTLYLATIPRLTSGAEYADLGLALGSTCDQLVATHTAGFVAADCVSVREATSATELAERPTDPQASAPEADPSCEANSFPVLVARDDDAVQGFGLSLGDLWYRVPAGTNYSYAHSGAGSLFAYDPAPDEYGDPNTGDATTAGFVVPVGSPTFLHFHHAYAFESYPAVEEESAYYPDGAQVLVQTLEQGTWTEQPSVPWVNGPDKDIDGYGAGWGGDSHGYGSSRVDLSSLAGKTVRLVFRVVGDDNVFDIGWWVDDIRRYTCLTDAPSQVRAPRLAAATTSARLSWTAPEWLGRQGVGSYLISRSDGKTATVPGSALSTTLTGLGPNSVTRIDITPRSAGGVKWLPVSVTVYPTITAVTTSTTRAVKGRAFTITAKVTRRGASTLVAGMPVTLQRHVRGEKVWRTVSTATTTSKGTRAWAVKQSQLTYYRLVSKGVTTWLGSTSSTKAVAVR